MYRLLIRIVLLWSIFGAIVGTGCWAAGNRSSGEEKKYQVIFSESYHNYLPGSLLRIGVVFKNSSSEAVKVSQELVVIDSTGVIPWNTVINMEISAKESVIVPLMVPVPKIPGAFSLTLTDATGTTDDSVPSFEFLVIQPQKSERLSKILVYTPDSEEGLNKFLKRWDIKAPELSWAQVLLLGKKNWTQYVKGDKAITLLVDRALKREMSVIFLDFGQEEVKEDSFTKILLPYEVSVSFIKAKGPEQSFVLKSGYKELTFGFTNSVLNPWNGYYGISVPATDLRFEGKGAKIYAYATSGENPFRFPLVELVPDNGKGKLYLCQIITDGRLDESVTTARNHPEQPAYDPMAVQFLLNLISETVGDNLLK